MISSGRVGVLIPIDFHEIVPGDTFKVEQTVVTRPFAPLKFPPLDTIYAETASFFVPYRLLQDDFEKLMGANPDTAWTQPVDYSVPKLTAPVGG